MLDRVRAALFVNWPIKLTALVLSALLWVGVAAEQPTSQLVPVTLDVVAPDGRTLSQTLPRVRALVMAPAREIVKLYGSPPEIHKIVPDSVSSSRYVLELSPSDVSLSAAGGTATVEDVQPRSIVIALDEGRQPVATAPRTGDSSADTGSVSERVLMGVPVRFASGHVGWESDPPAVIVTVRGAVARLNRLTRDSIAVSAVPLGPGATETVRLDVVAPAGITATATPDTAVVVRRTRG